MNKQFTSLLVILAIGIAPLSAQDFSDYVADQPSQEEIPSMDTYESEEAVVGEELAQDPSEDEQGTQVGAAASEGTNAAKKRQWQNIVIAVSAVAIAVTALILVSSNDGHHSHKNS